MQSVLWGIDQGADNVFHIEALYGRLFNSGDIKRGAKVCIVDTAFAKSLYGRENIVGKEIKVNLTSGPATYTVVGVASSGGNLMQGVLSSYIPTFLYVPYTSMGLTDSAQSSFDQIAVKVSGNVPFETASKELKATLERQIGEENVIKTENISKQKEQLNSILDTVTALLTVIGSIALVVAGLSIMTVMLVSVSERTREIGIKKAIGATRFIILKDFLAEAVVLSLMGSAIGAGAGVLLTVGGCLLVGLPPIIDWQMILIAIGFSVAMGTLFGVYPAMQAAKLRPVEAFRQE